ncbi:molybdopterin-guanine dinucleotide biosynthesis protein A [Paracoccus isoporae]|uniref:Molybdenum cofactor guanylyltransferase n=1 Tax=Paracoccus isoporae TaxID=591205 RepID=A0A1G7BCT8_9RHOB|nr:molybdenum cofactor guanylyltransferase MobA [Paracoccus isoporae]SDE24620.1 molybdopterin-guanine dinucleotide biosynthesis protein A [Paracoccus isoporae]
MTSAAPLPAVILAGGRATRMGGGDKVLLSLGGATLLDQVIARLRPQAGALAISANGDPARLARFGLPVLADPLPGYPGPLAGVLAAMRWAAGRGAQAVICVAGDTPFLPADLARRFDRTAPPDRIVLAAAPGPDGARRLHPTFGRWPVALRDALRAQLQDGRGRILDFAACHDHLIADFDDDAAFFNVNTPEDLARAQHLG